MSKWKEKQAWGWRWVRGEWVDPMEQADIDARNAKRIARLDAGEPPERVFKNYKKNRERAARADARKERE